MAKKAKSRQSKKTMLKNKAASAALPVGHIGLAMDDENTTLELSAATRARYEKIRNYIRHLCSVHNGLLDSSRSPEVKQHCTLLEMTIDAKIESMNAFLSIELDKARAKSPKRAVKRRKLSSSPSAKARRKSRREEPQAEKTRRNRLKTVGGKIYALANGRRTKEALKQIKALKREQATLLKGKKSNK